MTAARNACWSGRSSSAAPAHDRNRAVGPMRRAAEVLVGFQAAQDAQQVRPRPVLARDRSPALVVVGNTADGERTVHRRPAAHLPSLRVVERGAASDVRGIDRPVGERRREPHLVTEPVGIRDPGMTGPASISRTCRSSSSVSRVASARPAEPPPTMMSSYSPKQSSRPTPMPPGTLWGSYPNGPITRAPTVLHCGQRLAAFLRRVGATNPNAEEDGRARTRRIHPRRPLLDRHQPARPGSGPSLLPRPLRLGIRRRDARRIAGRVHHRPDPGRRRGRGGVDARRRATVGDVEHLYLGRQCRRHGSQGRAAGGTVLSEPFDVLDAGRMAVVADPEGAVFCVWQAKNHRGAKVVNEHGSLNFNGLATRDPEAAKAFYGAVFGWETLELPAGVMWTLPGYGDHLEESTPGLRDQMAQMGAPDRLHRRRRRAQSDRTRRLRDAGALERHLRGRRRRHHGHEGRELGGEVVAGPVDAPWTRTAVIKDPQGATFHRQPVRPGEPRPRSLRSSRTHPSRGGDEFRPAVPSEGQDQEGMTYTTGEPDGHDHSQHVHGARRRCRPRRRATGTFRTSTRRWGRPSTGRTTPT